MGSLKQFFYTASAVFLLLLAISDFAAAAPTQPKKAMEAWKNAANSQWYRQQMYIMQRPLPSSEPLHQWTDSQANGMLVKSNSQSLPWLFGKNEATAANYENGAANAKSVRGVPTPFPQSIAQQLRYFVMDGDGAPYDYYRRMGDALQQYNSLNGVDAEHPETRNTAAVGTDDDGKRQKTRLLFSTRIQPPTHQRSTTFLQRLPMGGSSLTAPLIKRGGGAEPNGNHADGMDGIMNSVMLRGRRMESIHNCYFTPLQCHFLEQLKR